MGEFMVADESEHEEREAWRSGNYAVASGMEGGEPRYAHIPWFVPIAAWLRATRKNFTSAVLSVAALVEGGWWSPLRSCLAG